MFVFRMQDTLSDPEKFLSMEVDTLVQSCLLQDVDFYGVVSPTVGPFTVMDREGNLIAGCIHDDKSGVVMTMNYYSTLLYGIYSVQKGVMVSMVDPNSFSSGVIDLSLARDRWEGWICNGKPCGYGCLLNGEDRYQYVGFMLDGVRYGYGFDYFKDQCIDVVEYEGTFVDDVRFGYGRMLDLNGGR